MAVAKREIPHSELAESKMTFDQMIGLMSDLQDELYIRGLEEPAILMHRALGKIQASMCGEYLKKKIEAKKNAA